MRSPGPLHRPADALRRPGSSAYSGKKVLRVPKLPPMSPRIARHASSGTPSDAASWRSRRRRRRCRHRWCSARSPGHIADRGARLHRHAGDALDPGVEAHDVRRSREGGIGRGLVADIAVDHDVRTAHRKAAARRFHRVCRRDHRRERLVIDDDQLGRILRRGNRFGDDEGDSRADVADPIGRQHVVWSCHHGRAIAVFQHDVGRGAGGARVRDWF